MCRPSGYTVSLNDVTATTAIAIIQAFIYVTLFYHSFVPAKLGNNYMLYNFVFFVQMLCIHVINLWESCLILAFYWYLYTCTPCQLF